MKKSVALVVILAMCALAVGVCLGCGGNKAGKASDSSEQGVELIYEARGENVDSNLLVEALERIQDRLDSAGIFEPEVSIVSDNVVVVELPRKIDAERAKELISKRGQLQFRIVKDSKEALAEDAPSETPEEGLKPEAEIVLPYKEKYKTYMMTLEPTALSGDVIKGTKVGHYEDGDPKVDFELTREGSSEFAEVTGANIDKQMAIVLDYEIVSAPTIKEPITEGRGEITGDFTEKEAEAIATELSNPIPVELVLIKEEPY